MTEDPLQHEIDLKLSSGARLSLLYFSDRDLRWIFSYDYVGDKHLSPAPEVVNEVRLVANYEAGVLTPQLVLSMHVIIPNRLGKKFFVGMDISPGAKTYLEFTYARDGDVYHLVEICKGTRERVRLADIEPAIMKPIEFPFPIPDRVPVDLGRLYVPFRTNAGTTAHFVLPTRTRR